MPVSIKTDLEWGDVWYIKNDPDQKEYHLVALTLRPGKGILFTLDFMGEELEVYDFQCSKEPDTLKQLKSKEDGEEP